MRDDKAAVTGDRSQQCGHCVAVCPADAIRVTAIDNDSFSFNTFEIHSRWLPHGNFDTAQLVRLMASRRSCRNYRDKAVPREMLEDLVKIGVTAPSGTNSQQWTFTILPSRESVLELGQQIGLFFRRVNRLAQRRWLRKLLKWIGKNQLENYYREHYQSVKAALEDWERYKRDRLFHGATALIVVGSKPGGSCPMEDAMLATQNILLAAHSMGLGSCLIGFAVEAMQNDPSIQRYLKIPDEEKVIAVVALGYPDETYQTLTGRKKIVPRYFVI
jgi:nitroreductase